MQCGATLEHADSQPPRPVERKVITALFCDLVGSTELAERLDPEDIDGLLRRYHALARARIESHGGVVEKFIGDAVVGVFGAPATHEDDPARAVRASLGIIGDLAASSLEIQVRIGIYTGEALVRVGDDRRPEEGLATGDCLNTAARLQNVAAPGGVAVGDTTHRLCAGQFAWEDAGPVELKGKARPVHVWQPVTELHDADASNHVESNPFVGREEDLATLLRAVERSAVNSSIEIITILAEPGMGKSRLIRELARRVSANGGPLTWRKGRCLPYGDGVSFWALGEIAKSHAGILESDDQATIGIKLDAALAEPDASRRNWMHDRLAPLVGLRTDAAPPPQTEAFAAWRRFILSFAATGPAILVIEDLHWADAALVEFLHDLAALDGDVPLMMIVTARPEVYERHPTWVARSDPATIMQLVSLDDAAIASLVESTLAGSPPSFLRTVLERAAGSPLYAEQLAALIRERGLSVADAALDATLVPPTVQALLAARIDALPRELKPALLDASVVGRVFWSGAVADLEGTRPPALESTLADLARRELTRSIDPSSMLGEAEYGFWHALLRDVAYAFLPRADRLAKHRAAARWISAKAADHLGALAEIVADHQRRALALAEATQAVDDIPEIRSDLATALLAAGAHAARIQPGRAVQQFREALHLLPADDPRRTVGFADLGHALLAVSEFPEAARMLDAAHAAYLSAGSAVEAAELAVSRCIALSHLGSHEATAEVLEDARAVLATRLGKGMVRLLAYRALIYAPSAERDLTLSRAAEVLALADDLGLAPPFRALYARAIALLDSGDRSGDAQFRRGIAVARESGDLRSALLGLGQLANLLMDVATPAEALAVYDEGLTLADNHGLGADNLRVSRLDALDLVGRWDEVLAEAPLLRARGAEMGDAWTTLMAELAIISVEAARGEPLSITIDLTERAGAVGLPPIVGVAVTVLAAFEAGEAESAHQAIADAIDLVPAGSTMFGTLDLVWTALRLDDKQLARMVLTRAVPEGPSGRGMLTTAATALAAEADGDTINARDRFVRATAFFRARGWAWYTAFSLLGAGRTSVALGEVARGDAWLIDAEAIARDLRAAPLLREIDAARLLARSAGSTA